MIGGGCQTARNSVQAIVEQPFAGSLCRLQAIIDEAFGRNGTHVQAELTPDYAGHGQVRSHCPNPFK